MDMHSQITNSQIARETEDKRQEQEAEFGIWRSVSETTRSDLLTTTGAMLRHRIRGNLNLNLNLNAILDC
eukprot:scaffold152634_cov31-Tisochrysis_lutea.AAC.4